VGLGLSIARSIVTAHGGAISVRAAIPHGAIFEVRLPVHADSGVTPS
jgi:signal transduction histidine kinase